MHATLVSSNLATDRFSVAEIAITLLRDGLAAMDENREAARSNIARACFLLEAERSASGIPGEAGRKFASGGLTPWQIRRVTDHIEANLDNPLKTFELSPLACLSGNYFARAFKQSFGITPRAYVVGRRIERARRMMLVTDQSLTDIAFACGFADQAHFTRCFHRAVGTPPHAWRRGRLARKARCAA